MNKSDFFTASNHVYGVTAEDYKSAALMLDAVRVAARVSNRKYYVIDYFKQGFLYVSDQAADILGMRADEVCHAGFDLYMGRVPDEDLRMLVEISDMKDDVMVDFSEDEMRKYVFSADFHLKCKKSVRTVHHKLTPLFMKGDRVWLALCDVSISSNRACGDVTIKKEGTDYYYKYVHNSRSWKKCLDVDLTDIEKDVVVNTMSGTKVTDMSDDVYRTEDSIKSCKKKLFKKLGVKNMHEAVTCIINKHML